MLRRRRHTLNVLLCAAAVVGAACSDSTAPRPAEAARSVARLAAFGGDAQTARQYSPVPVALQVRATDASDRPMAGVPVVFSVTDGGGTIAGAAARTDADGIAASGTWTLGPSGPQRVMARAGDVVAVFTATTLPPDATSTPVDTSGLFSANVAGRFAFLRDHAIILTGSDASQAIGVLRIAALPEGAHEFVVSPDRSTIAFVSGSTADLCVARANGSDVRCAGSGSGY